MSLLSRLAVQAARAYGILSSKSTNISVTYLAVAGGGGGGGGHGGGGGAGGFKTSTTSLSTLNTYSIAVGAGGLGGINYSDPTSRGSSGSDSSISGTGLSTITSTGGGGGGGFATNSGIGASGGSGGGGAGQTTAAGGSGTSGQGNSGGSGNTSAYAGAGGGGGAGAAGGNGSGTVGGTGGAGTASSISGSSVTYAGGGGGGIGVSATGGTGGAGGGGNGASDGKASAGGNGTVNTGGGGGGGGGDFPMTFRGGTGGSGVVIISYASATPKFVGGTLTTSGGNQIHTFTSSGTLSPLTPVTASYLVVAGGGGGGSGYAGGGGAGGYQTSSTTLYSGATYLVTVGAGGAGGTGSNSGVQGSNSVLSGTGITTVTSIGGGYGAAPLYLAAGGNGGSGGGSTSSGTKGSGTAGQGNDGGVGSSSSPNVAGGGGGGASAAGANGSSTAGGNGGAGSSSSISGSSVTYAGGGGGGTFTSGTAGTGGAGGGGAGSNSAVVAVSGTTNTGGGGGGGFQNSSGTNFGGGAGGSGVVIISYAGSQVFNGGLVTSSGGNTIHTFTATGALTPLTNNLNNSLRFRSSASAYLNRTPTLAGDRRTYTFSAWVKRGTLGSAAQALLGAGISNTVYDRISFESDSIRIVFNNGTYDVNTTQVFRDPSAWYHIVVAMDTTQATAANRTKIYVNGNQVTAFATASYPAQNHDTNINNNIANSIGALYAGSWGTYFDGYMTDINFIDGQALEPYYFGNNDANGVWKPILYKGTYGTNGFYLTFGNTTSTTTLGYDSSPNGNNWTTNNISLTAGTTYDAMLDVPTNTSATVANYAVMNPLSSASGTLTNGNLTFSNAGAVKGAKGTFALESGKWYWENTITTLGANDLGVGILFDGATDAMRDGTATSTYSVFYQANTNVRKNGTVVANYASYTTGDIIGIAYDADARSITFYKNNTSQGSITADAPTSPYVVWIIQPNSITATVNANFGQRPFAYTPPTGFVALNTYNLPTPTILQGNKYMDATLWSGDSTSPRVITNQAQFKPDLVWVKGRNGTINHILIDSVRGTGKNLISNSTGAEVTSPVNGSVSAFNSNGFNVITGTSDTVEVNYTGYNYVGWQWQAGQGSTSSNTQGNVTSTVSVNTTAGFSIVTYTVTSTSGMTIGHGLGVAPKLIIEKTRGSSANWDVYHASLGNTGRLLLNTTGAFDTQAGVWNNTSPTSTVFSQQGNGGWHAVGTTCVAYCWAEIAGFSKFGSWTGNASTDGPFVFCNFRPRFILFKNSSAVTVWIIFDTARNTYNFVDTQLRPNASDADNSAGSAYSIDVLSNGFKIRSSDSNFNGSGNTIIYAAFAEHPFKNSNSR